MAKGKLQDKPRQRLAAPAYWWSSRVRTVRKIDVRPKQLFSSLEARAHCCICGLAFAYLRTPGDSKKFEAGLTMAVHQLAGGGRQCDIVGLERNRSAACANAEDTIVLDHDRFIVETGERLPHERTILNLSEPFFKNRRLYLPFIPEL